MSKYSLVNLMENEEDGQFSSTKQTYDLLLTPTNKTIDNVKDALKNPKNYEKLFAKISKSDLEDYFGPQNPAKKKSIEKQRGVPFPVKTADEIKKFKEKIANPNKFAFEIEGETLRFPQSKNTLTLAQMESDLKTILDSAKIQYKIEKVPSK
jgi:hypothetical protein